MRPVLLPVLWFAACGLAMAKPKPKATAPATKKSVPELTSAARPSIVTVTQIGRGGEQEALGTGFVVGKDGLIATNLHVIGNSRRIQVQLHDGSLHDVTEIHATDPSLDLAIVKIKRQDLIPLALGDSDGIKQGQPIMVIGNPQGLEFSVVEGVISALREVEDTTMIQIAIPIEEGNSGGPLIDMEGRVQGIITLKSAVTNNLGFAHPVNQLKLLLDKPNPVPMSRWLTIGRLDSKLWEPLMGARWTQHMGVIHVEESGEGFGGRSLCLSKQEAPALPFEVSVQVRLDDEAGAAGLTFCADGNERHYGFYPSGGKLRLTRFNGADIFSWTILADVPHEAYHPGEWNTLRVRVDADKILCFVNDELVIEQQDGILRESRIGLCKFRQTKADFKNFRTGTSLNQTQIPAELAAQLETELNHFLEKPSDKNNTMEKLVAEPVAARRLLEQRAKALDEQAASLRKLQHEVHRQTVTREMLQVLHDSTDHTNLLKAALLVAKHDHPDLDVDAYLQSIDRMAEELKNDPAILGKVPAQAAQRLVTYLFSENGFHGSRSDAMDNFSNSYLNEVLDDREGIPITLSIVYLDLARRLGVDGIYGVSLPGRFMVAYKDKGTAEKEAVTFIDLYAGGKVLSAAETEHFISQSTGREVDHAQLEPATTQAIILRLLNNLTSFSKRPEQALPYFDLILAIDPESSTDRLNRAFMRLKAGNQRGAKEDLGKILESPPPFLDVQKIDALYQSL